MSDKPFVPPNVPEHLKKEFARVKRNTMEQTKFCPFIPDELDELILLTLTNSESPTYEEDMGKIADKYNGSGGGPMFNSKGYLMDEEDVIIRFKVVDGKVFNLGDKIEFMMEGEPTPMVGTICKLKFNADDCIVAHISGPTFKNVNPKDVLKVMKSNAATSKDTKGKGRR